MDLATLEKKIKELPPPSLSTEHSTVGKLPEIRGGRGAGNELSAAGPEAPVEVPEEEAEDRALALMAELVEEIRDSTHIRESDRRALCEQLAKGRKGLTNR